MDPNDPESLLQMTSPSQDPAALHRVITEVSRQANVLLTHHQQLDNITTTTEDLVRSVQALTQAVNRLTTPANPPTAAAAPPSPPAPAVSTATSSSARLSLPEKYDGLAGKCKGFLMQCAIYINSQPQNFPSDDSKVSLVCSLLTSKALKWATALWEGQQMTFPTYRHFLRKFKEVFDHGEDGKEAEEELLTLRQGSSTAADYALTFRTLAAQAGWEGKPLKAMFRRGLRMDLQAELTCRDEEKDLEEFMEMTIRMDNLLRSRRGRRFTANLFPQPSPATEEPMQIGYTRLTDEERDRRMKNRLCLYCGQPGHFHSQCPSRPPRPSSSRVSLIPLSPSLLLDVCIVIHGRNIKTKAFVDSGAAGNFIDQEFANRHDIPLLPCDPPMAVAALDGRPLGAGRIRFTTEDITLITSSMHTEVIRLHVTQSPNHPVILGHPWLTLHDPRISWREQEITHWSTTCQQDCLIHSLRTSTTSSDSRPEPMILAELPKPYQDLHLAFSKIKATQLPPHRETDCAIDLLPGATPPRGRVYPLSQPETQCMQQYIEEELSKGFIRPSTSPASAGFFFVKKKDGSLRPCIDYRALNEITIKFRYPLPLVPSALEQLRAARIFTKLDLKCAYNLIRIRAGDEWKTAFSTTSGHYEYLVMPFGLSNSPSVFQSLINDIFQDMLNKFVIVYIDDILVYSENQQDHINHVRAVLQRLIQHQLYAKLSKCEFHLSTVSFLGYIISAEGVTMDDNKVSAVLQMPRPQTLKELQRFLGFANFYRRFIRGFSQVAAPLTSLTRKGTTKLVWAPASEQAFQELKTRFTSAPILRHPDPSKQFIVEVDASNTGLGAILSQRHGNPAKLYPCAYYSRKLNPAERNYDVGDRELLAMKAALEEWRHWLEGATVPFVILTDYKNLEYLRTARRLNARQARWSLFFSRFHFQVTYRPGSRNGKADGLSRQYDHSQLDTPPSSIIPPTLIVSPVQWDVMAEITEAQQLEPAPPECPPERTYVPALLRQRLLSLIHEDPSAGHPGILATQELVGNKFWWPSMNQQITSFVKDCVVCNQIKSQHQRPAGLLQPLPIPERPWSHLAVDFVTDLPPSNHNTTVLTIIDRFSKACRFIPLPKLPTAWETAQILLHQVFRFYGLPEDIVSDRGPQFTSRVWRAFCSQLNINVSLTSGYHPQSNGQVERLNQELTKFLRAYCYLKQSDWSDYIVWAEYAQNSLKKPSTQLTPFQCILGFQSPLFPWSGETTNLPTVDSWLRRSEATWDATHASLRRAIQRVTRQANRLRRDAPQYQVGQWVWLSSKDLRPRLPCKKLNPRYVGPFKIIKQISPVAFRLQLPSHYRISPTFHVSLFKPAAAPGGEGDQDEAAPAETPPLVPDDEDIYQVNQILDSRHQGGLLQYLVDWEGYGPEERSWVSAKDILEPQLISNFHQDHPEKPSSSLREPLAGEGLCHKHRSGNLRPRSRPPPRTMPTYLG
ncbi:hypothetical protein M9458_008119 [Cirrhinus mrigala]|uniref:Gypsy retrotransposon integrase-like protein 1 n=1 Tax=Cirrhinus mrigala TaxID=683832 RepID=A0ABD0R9F9_CIRMR